MWDALAAAGLHRGDPKERELLWATAMLHDIGMAVDYDDHHKHSRYLILNAGLPGFIPREVALIGQAARYHRKGNPGLGEFAPLARDGRRGAAGPRSALLRLAEQLERSRDQAVHARGVPSSDGTSSCDLHADERHHARPLGGRARGRPLRAGVRADAGGELGTVAIAAGVVAVWLAWSVASSRADADPARITEDERAEHFEAVMTRLLRYLRPIMVAGLGAIAAGVAELAS